MQKIVLFVEETVEPPTELLPLNIPFKIPSKIGKLFMNRFAIDEDQNFEIFKMIKVESTPSKFVSPIFLEPGEGYSAIQDTSCTVPKLM